jgi:hypothetical protein
LVSSDGTHGARTTISAPPAVGWPTGALTLPRGGRPYGVLLLQLARVRPLYSGVLSMLQALAYGVYSRDTSQYDERIRAFKFK